MPYLIRRADATDISRLAELLEAYIEETYHGAWGGTLQLLEQHLLSGEVKIAIAEAPTRETVGFAAWVPAYDLHWCMKGGEVIDLFVRPHHRGRGVALLLIVEVAAEVQGQQGTYLKGGAVDDEIVHDLYGRFAASMSGDNYYLSGRAFRTVARMSGKGLREMIRGLPQREWNREP